MAAPKYDIIQTNYHNPDAEGNLKLNMVVVGNTPDEKIQENVKDASARYDNWMSSKPAHNGIAVLIGGGASINDCLDDIRQLVAEGATAITMNGSAKWARDHGINPDWQVIVDAKKETSTLVDEDCKQFFASQCDPDTLAKANDLTLIHLGLGSIEEYFPPEKVKKGGYALLGGGSTVGNAAMSVAFCQGFRELHLFGYDSSYKDGESHGYKQGMNEFMPTTDITWGGKTFTASVAMKGQAEKFPLNALALKNAGCKIEVYGDGLLQTIYNTRLEDLTEKEKYQLMWNMPSYRYVAPGEHVADKFIEVADPDGCIVDLGCGTGRGALRLAENGHDVICVDFTDNCRDHEAFALPFVQADLTEKLPVKAKYGFCTDVMEHIPPCDVDRVMRNIREATDNVFYQISLVDDACGDLIGHPLHLTVKPYEWWLAKMSYIGYSVTWSENRGDTALFYCVKE